MRGECLDDAGDGVPQGVDGAGGGFSKGGLELGEGVLDGVEGGALGRKKQQQGADRLDSGADGRALVGGQAVHHDDVAGGRGSGPAPAPHRRGRRRRSWGRPAPWGGGHVGQAQGPDEGGGFPVTVRQAPCAGVRRVGRVHAVGPFWWTLRFRR